MPQASETLTQEVSSQATTPGQDLWRDHSMDPPAPPPDLPPDGWRDNSDE